MNANYAAVGQYYDRDQFAEDLRDIIGKKFLVKTAWRGQRAIQVNYDLFDTWSLERGRYRRLIDYLGRICDNVQKVYERVLLPFPRPNTTKVIEWLSDEDGVVFTIGEVDVLLMREEVCPL